MIRPRDLKHTRVYQEAKEEGRQEALQEEREKVLKLAVLALVDVGLSVEQVAEKLRTDEAAIKRILGQ